MFAWSPSPPDLKAWLHVATRGLCAPAVERIGEEIRDFYQSAVDEALDRGISPEKAEAYALQQLGRASAARRRFRAEHMTEYEAKYYTWFMCAGTPAQIGKRGVPRPVLWIALAQYILVAPVIVTTFPVVGSIAMVTVGTIGLSIVLLQRVPSARLDTLVAGKRAILLNLLLNELSALVMVPACYALLTWPDERRPFMAFLSPEGFRLFVFFLVASGVYALFRNTEMAMRLVNDRSGLLYRDLEERAWRQFPAANWWIRQDGKGGR